MPLQTHTDADFATELQRFVAPSAHSSAPPFRGHGAEMTPVLLQPLVSTADQPPSNLRSRVATLISGLTITILQASMRRPTRPALDRPQHT